MNDSSTNNGIPKFIKGKTVLQYNDGSWGVRPSIWSLMETQPNVAKMCLKQETPSIIWFWWDNTRPLAKTVPTTIGFILGLIVSLNWIIIIPTLNSYISGLNFVPDGLKTYIPLTLFVFACISCLSSLITTASLYVSALKDRSKAKEQNEDLNVFKQDKFYVTPLRFLAVSVFYGPFVWVVLVLYGLYQLLNLIIEAVTQ